jgi:hypothetical protein
MRLRARLGGVLTGLLRRLLTRLRCGLRTSLRNLARLRLACAGLGLITLRLAGLGLPHRRTTRLGLTHLCLVSLRLPDRGSAGRGLSRGGPMRRLLLGLRVSLRLSNTRRSLLARLDANAVLTRALLRLDAYCLLMLARRHCMALVVLAFQCLPTGLCRSLLTQAFGGLVMLALHDLLRLPLLGGTCLNLASAIGLVAVLLLHVLRHLTLTLDLLAARRFDALALIVPCLRDLLLAALLIGALAGGGETLLLGGAFDVGAGIEIGRRAPLTAAAPIGVAHGCLLARALFGAPMLGLLFDGVATGGVAAPIVTASALDRIAATIPLRRRHASMAPLARCPIERSGAGIITRRGDTLGTRLLQREQAAAAAIDRNQRAVGIGIAVIGIADIIRIIVAGLVIIGAIAAIDRFGEGFVAVAALPCPGLDAIVIIEGIIGRSLADHLVEGRGAIGIGVIGAARRSGYRNRARGRQRTCGRRIRDRCGGRIAHRYGIGKRRQGRPIGEREIVAWLHRLVLLRMACRQCRRDGKSKSGATADPEPAYRPILFAERGVSSHGATIERHD